MRPNHQNKQRMRGRNRNGGGGSGGGGGGGKGPNPLTRSYESNGPDVKIRGNAQHIAEKYVQLGRDAQATGDHVAAESYFQHAEHYFRLIAAAQDVLRQQNPGYRPFESGMDQDGDEGDDDIPFGHGSPQPEMRFSGTQSSQGESDTEQPRQYAPQHRETREYQPREPREQRDFQPRDNREPPPREQREPRERRDFQPREPREPRDFQPREPRDFQQREYRFPRDAGDQREPRFPRGPRPERAETSRAPVSGAVEPDAGLPAFITAPVRAVAPASGSEQPEMPVIASPVAGETGPFEVNPRPRRRGRPPRVVEGPAPAVDDTPGE